MGEEVLHLQPVQVTKRRNTQSTITRRRNTQSTIHSRKGNRSEISMPEETAGCVGVCGVFKFKVEVICPWLKEHPGQERTPGDWCSAVDSFPMLLKAKMMQIM